MPSVTICDVGPRDGLQNLDVVLEPAVRAELVDRLAATGLPCIEAVSFVNPARVAQMAGAEDVVAAVERRSEVVYAGLVLNEKGYDRLVSTWLHVAHVSFGASETFNRRNQGASVEESAAAALRIAASARADGRRSTVTISTAFGCPFEGHVDPGRVAEIAAEMAAGGADAVLLADTIGVAVPRQVRELVSRLAGLAVPVGVHLHNTRNTGFANALAALGAGATLLDSSVGGIGGCPFAPGATGNIATEDLVYLLDGEGVETGVDLDAVVRVASWLEGVLGRRLDGQVYRVPAFPPVAPSGSAAGA
jgi:hydroxymethylglutaryl-CoA lyase/(R)-citramalyl-CoA lyase